MEKLNNNGISEILGTILLFGISIALFSVIYVTSLSDYNTTSSPLVNIVGYVDESSIILEHHGGDSLNTDTIIEFTIAGSSSTISITSSYLSDYNNNDKWDVGEKIVYTADVSGKQIEAAVTNQPSNTALFLATIQEGTTSISPGSLITTVSSISPYELTNSPKTINATSSGDNPDNVTLFYRWSNNNESWQTGYQTIVIGNNVTVQGTGTSLEITKPSGLEDGDILVAFVVKDDNAGTLSSPSGWIQSAYQSTTSGSDLSSGIWYKVVEDVDDESSNSSYTWTHTDNNEQMTGGILIVKNVNSTNPLDATTVSDAGTNDNTIDCPSITTNTNNAMVLTFACKTHGVSSATKPAGTTKAWTELFSHSNNYCSYYIQTTAGATGIKTWTDNQNKEWHSYQMAFKPFYSEGFNWTVWSNANNPDTSSPWSWTFNFPNSTGYYEFYSIGKKMGLSDEATPSSADAICQLS